MTNNILITEITRDFSYFKPIIVGPIPTACDPEGIYPYTSFSDTEKRPYVKKIKIIQLENQYLKVQICPELGGRVHSIFHKQSQSEILYKNEEIKPVRILPRGGFVSGGIEVSFPVSHSPMQLEELFYETKIVKNRAYVWFGEREKRFGMNYTVEFSLGSNDKFLTQRLLIINQNRKSYPWMSWSNAAVLAKDDSIYQFPGGDVLKHGSEMKKIDWNTEGPSTVSKLDEMTGYFWHKHDSNSFGIYTPSLGSGLYHIASPDSAPGMKLWTYGKGKHERWGEISGTGKNCYIEVQGGPLADQSIKSELEPMERQVSTEFWIPSPVKLEIKDITLPKPELMDVTLIPIFDYTTNIWNNLLKSNPFTLPEPDMCNWIPSGFEKGDILLKTLLETCRSKEKLNIYFHLGCWYSARDQYEDAVEYLELSNHPIGLMLAARIYSSYLNNFAKTITLCNKVTLTKYAKIPQVMIEMDKHFCNGSYISEREILLKDALEYDDEFLNERVANLMVDKGEYNKALDILLNTQFQLVHQRYERTAIWNKIKAVKPEIGRAPESLGEDTLAEFGAYREY